MGMKFLNLQIIPQCFHPGLHKDPHHQQQQHHHDLHYPSGRRRSSNRGIIKLIQSDGFVKIYNRPVHVSDLMVEFPKHLVCRSDSFYIGKKIPHLSDKEQLQLGHNYFLLPQHFFQSVLSFMTIASIATSSQTKAPSSVTESKNAAFLKKAAAHCRPFSIEKTPSGCLQIRVSDEFISHLTDQTRFKDECGEELSSGSSRVCSTPQLVKDYSQLVVLPRQWKPKLETIKEKKEKRKLSSFGMKKRTKKSQPSKSSQVKIHKKSEQQLQLHAHVTTTGKAYPRITIKNKSRKSYHSLI